MYRANGSGPHIGTEVVRLTAGCSVGTGSAATYGDRDGIPAVSLRQLPDVGNGGNSGTVGPVPGDGVPAGTLSIR